MTKITTSYNRIEFLFNTCLVFEDRVAQCLNGLYVQVIGGLVENQKVGLMTTQYSKGHARLLSSRQALDLYAAKYNPIQVPFLTLFCLSLNPFQYLFAIYLLQGKVAANPKLSKHPTVLF